MNHTEDPEYLALDSLLGIYSDDDVFDYLSTDSFDPLEAKAFSWTAEEQTNYESSSAPATNTQLQIRKKKLHKRTPTPHKVTQQDALYYHIYEPGRARRYEG